MLARPRLAVLGLDGLPLALARELAPRLPHLAGLLDGVGSIEAELPELSPVNWTSLATAEGPEVHGVFGFTRLDPRSYELSLTDATQVACPTLFDRLGGRGLVSRVVNLPNTYPARPLRGMMVAGFVAPDLRHAVFPPFLAAQLARLDYRLEADTTRGAQDPAYLLAGLKATLASRRAALDLLWPDLAWDLFVFVLTETDRLFHFLWSAVTEQGHPLHQDCLELLEEWDRCIGAFLERYTGLAGPKRLVVLADHGFTRLVTEVDLNRWLVEAGLLRLLPPRKHGADAEWEAARIAPQSAALALDPGRIWLHDQRRFGRGRLSDQEARTLAEQIRDALLGLTFQGERVMEQVFFGRDLYPGAAERFGAAVPDLVCLARPGFDLKAKFDRDRVFGRFGRDGAHTARDAFFHDSHGARPERVRDAGRLILEHFGTATCP